MSKKLVERLVPDAAKALERILQHRRKTFWGDTELFLKIRSYPKSGEERVSIVRPQFLNVRLYSQHFKRFFKLQTTPHVLRQIEETGGLDDYLLRTPHKELRSDVASDLKLKLTKSIRQQAQQLTDEASHIFQRSHSKAKSQALQPTSGETS